MKFNEKLILLRKNRNLSQEELGNKLDVARQTVSKWELGETTPEMDKLIRISQIFEISLDQLMKEEDLDVNSNNFNQTNTQKLAGLVIKILKAVIIFFIISIVIYGIIAIASIILFKTNKRVEIKTEQEEIISLDGEQ